MELMTTWTTDDVKHIAEEEGIELTDEQLEAAVDLACEYLNEDDRLNEMIWNNIIDAIREAKEEEQ